MVRISDLAIAIVFASTTALAAPVWAQVENLAEAHASLENRWLEVRDCLLEAENELAIPAQETGVLKLLHVKLNEAVLVGQELARLDSSDAENELKTRRQDYRFAVDLANDDSDIAYHQNSLRVAEEDLANYRKIAQSVSDFEIVRRELARDGAKLAVRRAEKVKERAIVDAARLGIAMEAAMQKLNRSLVVAPSAGVISEILVRPGEWVRVGEPLLRLSDMKRLVVHAHVNVDQIDRSKVIGTSVRVASTTDSGEKFTLRGRITSYDHGISSSGLLRVHAEVENEMLEGHWRLLPGKHVTLYLSATKTTAETARDSNLAAGTSQQSN